MLWQYLLKKFQNGLNNILESLLDIEFDKQTERIKNLWKILREKTGETVHVPKFDPQSRIDIFTGLLTWRSNAVFNQTNPRDDYECLSDEAYKIYKRLIKLFEKTHKEPEYNWKQSDKFNPELYADEIIKFVKEHEYEFNDDIPTFAVSQSVFTEEEKVKMAEANENVGEIMEELNSLRNFSPSLAEERKDELIKQLMDWVSLTMPNPKNH